MTRSKLRSLGIFPLAVAVIAALGVVPALHPTLVSTMNKLRAEVALADNVSLIMGGSGLPIPGADYIAAVDRYLSANDFGQGENPQALFTPEGLYPLTGVKTLPLDTSVDQGVTILNSSLTEPPSAGVAGDNIGVLGYSQSAVISSLEMEKLAAAGNPIPTDDLHFALLGDPMAPNGGLLERFEGLMISSLGVDFYGATPDDTPYETNIYTLEYDGFADFPRYPINLLSDINAFLGIATIHGTYPMLTDDQISGATLLPGSTDYTGDLPDGVDAATNTNYYMIEQTAPLVSLLNGISPQLGALLGPDLTYLINLGYGDGTLGYSDAPANVATPFGLFPDVSLSDVLTHLSDGFKQGMQDMMDLPPAPDPSDPGLGDAAAGSLSSFTDIVNAFSSALSSAYSVLLPTADILNALGTSLPAYELQLFTDGLQGGDFLDALGKPIAAAVGLETLALGFEFDAIKNAVTDITDAFSGIAP